MPRGRGGCGWGEARAGSWGRWRPTEGGELDLAQRSGTAPVMMRNGVGSGAKNVGPSPCPASSLSVSRHSELYPPHDAVSLSFVFTPSSAPSQVFQLPPFVSRGPAAFS